MPPKNNTKALKAEVKNLRQKIRRLEGKGKSVTPSEKAHLEVAVNKWRTQVKRLMEQKGKVVVSPGPKPKPFGNVCKRQKRRRAEDVVIEAGEPSIRDTTDKL